MKKLIILTDWFYPAYKAGGPITSLTNLVNGISGHIDVSVLTSAYDLGEKKNLDNIVIDNWQNVNNYRIKYLTDVSKVFEEMLSDQYDCIYLNSMFSPAFTIRPLIKARSNGLLHEVILAPRGMLAEGALSLKPLKKKLFLLLFKLFGVPTKITFHATSKQEEIDIKRTFSDNVNIKLIPNFPGIVETYTSKHNKIPNELKLISVARIAEEKNTLFLLELLKYINSTVTLNMYGMIKTESYLESCNNIIKTLQPNVKVNIFGEIPFYEIKKELNENHFFILPTLGENFGHAIYEAMCSGTPVIISDKTPWRNLEQHKAGWDIPLSDKNKFIEVLNKCAEMDNEEYQEWSKGAFNFAKKYYEENDPTEAYLEMFAPKV